MAAGITNHVWLIEEKSIGWAQNLHSTLPPSALPLVSTSTIVVDQIYAISWQQEYPPLMPIRRKLSATQEIII